MVVVRQVREKRSLDRTRYLARSLSNKRGRFRIKESGLDLIEVVEDEGWLGGYRTTANEARTEVFDSRNEATSQPSPYVVVKVGDGHNSGGREVKEVGFEEWVSGRGWL